MTDWKSNLMLLEQERRQGGCFKPVWGDKAGVILDGMLFARAG
jgi:hypothetical protein